MLNIDFFNVLNDIDNLFSNLTYKKREIIESPTLIKLSFINRQDYDYKYIVEIYNNDNVKVTIPINNTNYLYTTYFDNITCVLYYLSLHININSKYNLLDKTNHTTHTTHTNKHKI